MSVAICDTILSKVINIVIDLGEIFECGFERIEDRKMFITFDRIMEHLWYFSLCLEELLCD